MLLPPFTRRNENSAKISACITEKTYQNRKIPVIIPLLQMCKRKERKNRIRAYLKQNTLMAGSDNDTESGQGISVQAE